MLHHLLYQNANKESIKVINSLLILNSSQITLKKQINEYIDNSNKDINCSNKNTTYI